MEGKEDRKEQAGERWTGKEGKVGKETEEDKGNRDENMIVHDDTAMSLFQDSRGSPEVLVLQNRVSATEYSCHERKC